MRKLSIPSLVFTLVAATPVAAAPERAPTPAAVASAQVAGTMLVVSPNVAYSSATLRVAGPDGYEAIAWSQGGDITLDLLADGSIDTGGRTRVAARSLPNGRYGYEVVLHGANERQDTLSGSFSVDRGVVRQTTATPPHARGGAASRAQGSAGPGTESDSTDESYHITDNDNDGLTFLELQSLGSGTQTRWLIESHDADLHFNDVGPAGAANNHRFTFGVNGDMGIGTTVPQDDLHIFRPTPTIRLADSDACPNNNATWEIGPTAGFLDFGPREDCPGTANATWMSLNAATGNLGLGELSPQRKVHVTASAPGVRLEASPSGQQWDLEATATHFAMVNVTAGQFPLVIRANAPTVRMDNGGFGIGVAVPAATLHVGGSGRIDGDVALGSSRTLKTGFGSVNPAEMLARVADLPLASWRYKSEDESTRHIGPFAEDFQRLFGLGDGETISVIDAQGVTLAAIQGLQRELAEKDAQIEALTARLTAVEAHLDATR